MLAVCRGRGGGGLLEQAVGDGQRVPEPAAEHCRDDRVREELVGHRPEARGVVARMPIEQEGERRLAPTAMLRKYWTTRARSVAVR